jgi:peroxiredoxin/mono/diheme cytochrome c family protein
MFRIVSILVAACVATSAWAVEVGERVENFRLLAHTGDSHELYYYSNLDAVVFLVQGNGCPIVRNAAPRFAELRDEFADQNVKFFMLNSNLQDNRASITKEAKEFGYDIPILMDDTQIIGESLDLVRTGEVFVVDPKTWKVAYSGALDDRLTYENQKKEASAHYLRDAVANMTAGEPVALASTDSLGCLINFPEKTARANHANISYSNDIAPILADNCVSCHREGGIGPWAMTDYNMVRGFSLMIREVVRTQRMPPWHADPAHGEWANDRSLSDDEIKTLVHWIEAGAPRGEGEDMLANLDHEYSEWTTSELLGDPDYVVDIPAMEIPATGVVDYQYHLVDNPIGKDVWVHAAEILPGDRAVLHHTITTFGDVMTEGKYKGQLNRKGGLRGYAPGITNQAYPDGTGTFLPADATIEFQMHYTPVGRATVDESKMGIWVYDEPPTHPIISMFTANPRIKIPPHAANHMETVERTIPKDALLYNLMPHAHFRGKAANFIAKYPDGTEELLLSVPHYDFNWQTDYEFKEPKFIPAGTTLVQTGWWDNSAQNKANPDPSAEVTWGEQSWEEMLFGAMLFRFLTEEESVQMRAERGMDKQTQEVASAR